MTVEPELYSTTVLVFPGTTSFASMFIATAQVRTGFCRGLTVLVLVHTWQYLDIICRMHRHHLCIDSDSVLVEWVQARWDFYERKGWVVLWIEVFLQGVRARINVEWIC